MSFELSVEGGRTVSVEAWRNRVRRLGGVVELHPGFVMATNGGVVPLSLSITKRELFPDAPRFVSAGPLCAGIEVEIEAFGADATGIAPAETRARFAERLRYLAKHDPVDGAVERCRSKQSSFERSHAGEPDEQRVHFRTATGRSGVDFLAVSLCAAAYALASGGTLVDPQQNGAGRFSGDAILGILAKQLGEHFISRDQYTMGQSFRTWDA